MGQRFLLGLFGGDHPSGGAGLVVVTVIAAVITAVVVPVVVPVVVLKAIRIGHQRASAQCNGTGCVVPVHLFVHQFSNAPHRQIDRAAVKQGVYGIAVGVSEGLTDIVHQNGNVRPDGSLNRLCLGCRIRGSRH